MSRFQKRFAMRGRDSNQVVLEIMRIRLNKRYGNVLKHQLLQNNNHTLVTVRKTVSKTSRIKHNYCNFCIFCNFKIERFGTGKIPTEIMCRALAISPYFSRYLFFPVINKPTVITPSKVIKKF